jgi:integrase
MPSPWRHPQHGTYYIRIEVPADLREAIGKRWIKKSLRTSILREAKPRFTSELERVHALFESHRKQHTLTFEDAEILASRLHRAELEGLNDVTNLEQYIVVETERDPDTGELYENPIPYSDFDTSGIPFAVRHNAKHLMEEQVGKEVDNLIVESGYKVNKGSPSYHRLDVDREAVKAYQGRWKRPKTDKVVDTPLSSERAVTIPQRATEGQGISLTNLIESYIAHGVELSQWTDRTLTEVHLVLDGFKSHIGGGVDPESITRQQFRDFRILLSRLPGRYSNSDKYKGLTLQQIVAKTAKDGATTLAPATVYKKFTFIVALFKFALLEEIVTANRAAAINKKVEVTETKPVFTDSDIQRIFDHYSDRRDSTYWIPRLALLGMRQGEICQLQSQDFKQFDGIHYIELGPDKILKTKNSRRKIPIPDFLINVGLLEFVERKNGPLFTVNREYYSKAFNKTIKEMGLKPKNFHTFRHTFRARLRQADVSIEAANLLGGWANSAYSTGDHYGREYRAFLERLHKAVNALEYRIASYERATLEKF